MDIRKPESRKPESGYVHIRDGKLTYHNADALDLRDNVDWAKLRFTQVFRNTVENRFRFYPQWLSDEELELCIKEHERRVKHKANIKYKIQWDKNKRTKQKEYVRLLAEEQDFCDQKSEQCSIISDGV